MAFEFIWENGILKNNEISFIGMIVCLTASTYAMYDFFIAVAPSVMTSQLMHSFHMTSTGLGWVGASFFYAYAIMQLPSGWMLDRYGAKRMMISYSLLSCLGLILFATTSSYFVAMIGRFLSGTGVCIGFLASYYLASRWLPHRYFSTAAAALHCLGTVGAIIAQRPLALMVNNIGWRYTNLNLAAITVVLTMLYLFFIRDGESSTEKSKTKLREALSYCYGNTQLRWIALVAFLAWLPFSTIGALWGVPYLIKVFNWDNLTASNFCALFWIGSGLGGFVLCGLSEWRGRRKKPMQLFFLIAVLSSLVIVWIPTFSKGVLLLSMLMLGLSVSVQTLTFSLIKENVPQQYFSAASGLNNSISMLSSAMGQALIGILMDWHRINTHTSFVDYTISDYQFALAIVPIIAIIGWFVVTFKIKETYCIPVEKRLNKYSYNKESTYSKKEVISHN